MLINYEDNGDYEIQNCLNTRQCIVLEGTARYAGLFLAPAEGFSQICVALQAKKPRFTTNMTEEKEEQEQDKLGF